MISSEARSLKSRYPDVEIRLEGSKTWVQADREALSSVVRNLLDNAAQMAGLSQDGKAWLQASWRQNGEQAAVDVEDSGPGVSDEDRDQIFRPFFTKRQGGTGLGLALARKLARAHGGDLELAKARPAVFRLTLPLMR